MTIACCSKQVVPRCVCLFPRRWTAEHNEEWECVMSATFWWKVPLCLEVMRYLTFCVLLVSIRILILSVPDEIRFMIGCYQGLSVFCLKRKAGVRTSSPLERKILQACRPPQPLHQRARHSSVISPTHHRESQVIQGSDILMIEGLTFRQRLEASGWGYIAIPFFFFFFNIWLHQVLITAYKPSSVAGGI